MMARFLSIYDICDHRIYRVQSQIVLDLLLSPSFEKNKKIIIIKWTHVKQ